MKSIYLFLTIICASNSFAQIGIRTPTAQISSNNSGWTFGGYAGLGGSFGRNSGTTVYITPRLGYKLTEDFEMGVAGNFSWNNSSYHSSTMLGVGPFANLYLGRVFYLTSQFQEYFINQRIKTTDQKHSSNEAALYLGAGYMQSLGGRTYMQIGAMYNVLYKEDQSIFDSGFIPQIGVVFGL